MAAVDLTIMTPIVINSTTLPVANVTNNLGINTNPFRHSGLPFASQLVVDTITPTVTFQAPFEAAHSLMGFDLLKATTFEVYNRTFTNFEANAGGVFYELASSASACCYIQNVSEVGGVMMADCVAMLLSADGTTHPLAAQASAVAIPTVSAEPQLQVRGPLVVNNTRLSGVQSVSFSLGQRVLGAQVDGDTYPRTVVYDGGLRQLTIGHASSKAAIAEIGLFGSDIGVNNVVQYFRDVDSSTGLTTGSAGASLTIADGRVEVTDAPQSVGSTDGCNIIVTAIDADGDETDPVAVSFAATMPAA